MDRVLIRRTNQKGPRGTDCAALKLRNGCTDLVKSTCPPRLKIHHRLLTARRATAINLSTAVLKEIAPSVTRAAVLRDLGFAHGIGQFAVIQAVAPSVGIEVSPIDLREPDQIERAIATFAQSPNGGIILAASGIGASNANLIITAAARYKLPAVYIQRSFVVAGGLISYGPNFDDQYRRAAGYVDRILRGEKPGDLPVQVPSKYELAINLKTAKALGLSVPPSLLARADKVIE